MKNVKWLFFLLILVFVCFVTCENAIMETWWTEEEPNDDDDQGNGSSSGGGGGGSSNPQPPVVITVPSDPEIITIVEKIIETEYIYNTIILEVPVLVNAPPEVWRQYIDVVEIEFIVFAGDSGTYNGPPEGLAVTPLTAAEQARNDMLVMHMAQELSDKHDEFEDTFNVRTIPYFLLLHGHANPVLFTEAEKAELTILSNRRTAAVEAELVDVFNSGTLMPLPVYTDATEFGKLISKEGYGGGMTIGGEAMSNQWAALNRRVELILFTIRNTPLDDPGK